MLGASLERCNIPYTIFERASTVKPLGTLSSNADPFNPQSLKYEGAKEPPDNRFHTTNLSSLFFVAMDRIGIECWRTDHAGV